jgi:hypothetical protein
MKKGKVRSDDQKSDKKKSKPYTLNPKSYTLNPFLAQAFCGYQRNE